MSNEPIVYVNVDLMESLGAQIHERMRYSRRNNNDLASTRFQCGRANREGRYSFLYDKNLLVGVFMQSYRTAGRHVNPDK
jgi:hypothetical protein